MSSHYICVPSHTKQGPLRPQEVELAAMPCYFGSDYPDGDCHRPDTCDLCFKQMGPESIFRRLPCQHIFHRPCIDRWMCTWDASCPFCRQTFYHLRRAFVIRERVTVAGPVHEHNKDAWRESRAPFVLWWRKKLHLC